MIKKLGFLFKILEIGMHHAVFEKKLFFFEVKKITYTEKEVNCVYLAMHLRVFCVLHAEVILVSSLVSKDFESFHAIFTAFWQFSGSIFSVLTTRY